MKTQISTYKEAIKKLSINFCNYNNDCAKEVNHQEMRIYHGQEGVEKVIIDLFTQFNKCENLISKEEAIEKAFSRFSCCGYTSECGDNNVAEIFDGIYNYFIDSMSDNPSILSVPKAVEIGIINFDSQLYMQNTIAWADMNEEFAHAQSIHFIKRYRRDISEDFEKNINIPTDLIKYKKVIKK